MKKQIGFKTKGMNQDLSVSAFNPEFSFENRNLRLSTNEGNTLLSWVNERGTSSIEIVRGKWNPEDKEETTVTKINGTPIGSAVLNSQLVLFTTGENDYIYVLKYTGISNNKMLAKQLFEGKLNFDIEHPLETLVSYESERIQKVYWVDGKNQPRLINLGGDLDNIDTSFDFVSTLQLKEIVSVQKNIGSEGMFAPGVIQYAMTYISKNGQESNIFYTTPLYYISYVDRGVNPEEKVANSFTIEIYNADANFDLLRIYSIQRTSIDGTPICKRLQDISLKDFTSTEGIISDTISYIDTGLNGDTIDPTELQYKGGETIIAKTMEQKDNTLFLGNFSIKRELFDAELSSKIKEELTNNIESAHRTIKCVSKDNGSDFYRYCNQLSSTQTQNGKSTLVSCGGFKKGENYRLGVQFQNETGKWSDPIFIDDFNESKFPTVYTDSGVKYDKVVLAGFRATLSSELTKELPASYKKVRPLVVFPNISDRHIICQGIAAPTVYTVEQRGTTESPGTCYAQSSWFFRPYIDSDEWLDSDDEGNPKTNDLSVDTPLVYPTSHDGKLLPSLGGLLNPRIIRKCECNGYWSWNKRFRIDRKICTLHSPEAEFDDNIASIDFTGMKYQSVGTATFDGVSSDIDLQVNGIVKGGGFRHRSFENKEGKGLCAGAFYGGWMMDDNVLDSGQYGPYPWGYQNAEVGFFVFPWQRDGSVNNDCSRSGQLDILKKKIISNLRYSTPSVLQTPSSSYPTNIQLFNSDEITITKLGDKTYQGNYQNYVVDDWEDGVYFTCTYLDYNHINTNPGDGWEFDSANYKEGVAPYKKTYWGKDSDGTDSFGAMNYWDRWLFGLTEEIGETNSGLICQRKGTHIEYKSTPHIVFERNDVEVNNPKTYEGDRGLSIVEVVKDVDEDTIFGGKSIDALKANIWIPCGEPVVLGCDGRTGKATDGGSTVFYYDYGDTYYQRFDCLKTYPFTLEDQNQIIEIGSFMVETRQNIDGRYDRNRGQTNNLYMYPGKNFNLMNPVYSQLNNFFTYRIQDEDAYKDTNYPNYIMWSKTKENGAISDLWTNITMASTLALDGDKGEITSLQRLNNNLICFQDRGISRIQYMENVQVSSTQGVPIEIANSDKVRGKDYISNTIGCSNKWSIVSTPAGIYFMDSNEKSIYRLGEGLQNISQQGGFNSWCKQNIPSPEVKWNPSFPENNLAFVGYYDHKNQDVLYINRNTALAFSEKLGAFTSFYDYGSTPWFCVLNDTGIWVREDGTLWQHQAGEYCNFFGTEDNPNYKPYGMTLVGNPEPQMDKIFTNLEFRASVEGDGEPNQNADKFAFYLPFDSLKTWNDYQEGETQLQQRWGHSAAIHYGKDGISTLKRKFRIWRCDIPRDNNRRMDRMRNPWLYLKLWKGKDTNRKVEIHDIVMSYFD